MMESGRFAIVSPLIESNIDFGDEGGDTGNGEGDGHGFSKKGKAQQKGPRQEV
jgi:hypothetical protein